MTHSSASGEGSSRDSQALENDEGTWYMSPIVMNSPTRRRIRRAVYGDEFPEDADPSSYITVTELRRFARDLGVGPGDAFVDLGCGRGCGSRARPALTWLGSMWHQWLWSTLARRQPSSA